MASIKTDRNLENLSGKVCSNLPENGQRFIRHFVQKSKIKKSATPNFRFLDQNFWFFWTNFAIFAPKILDYLVKLFDFRQKILDKMSDKCFTVFR